jgi:hypothetical protein
VSADSGRVGYTMTRASDGAPILHLVRDTEKEVIEDMERQLKGSFATHVICGGRMVRVVVTITPEPTP